MNNIREWFESDMKNSGEEYDISGYEGHLEVRTDIALFMVVEPHSGTKNRWMLRVAPISSFDRWANSTAVEEFFDTEIEVCNYLSANQLDIYKDILRRLSEDYHELSEDYDELSEDFFLQTI